MPARPPSVRGISLRRTSAVLLLAGLLCGGASAAAATRPAYAPVQRTNIDRPVPAGATVLPNGRLVSPAGRTVGLGDFPEGLAVSPDGVLAVASGVGQGDGTPGGTSDDLCVDGQHKHPCKASSQAPSPTTGPDEALFVTNLKTGAYSQVRTPESRCKPAAAATVTTLHCFELGLTFSPDGKHLYATGGGNDGVYDFAVSAAHELSAAPVQVRYLQEVNTAPGGSGAYQTPNPGSQAARTKGIAVTPDGATVLVTKEQSGSLDVLSAKDLSLQQRVLFGAANPTGANGSVTYPYAVVVAPDGKTAYVSLQGTGQVAAVSLTSVGGRVVAGPPVLLAVGDHPTGLAVSPDGNTLLVTNANDDTVSVVPLSGGRPGPATTVTVHAKPDEVLGSVPNAVAFASNSVAYVALAGDDAVAALQRTGDGAFTVTGMVPTGWYPTSVAVRPQTGELLAVSAKGLGSGYTAHGGYPKPTVGGPQAAGPGNYDGNNMPGLLTITPAPTAAQLVAGQATAVRNIDFAAGAKATAPGPIPTDPSQAGNSPIKHVVYIVRENRTYDQVYGDLAHARNDVDADPAFESLSSATPNGHALVGRYASSDSFFSDGEASVQGHYWTTSANVDDYVEKSWRQYYSSRNHSSDSVGTAISMPRNCSIFQAALAKGTDPTSPFFNPTFTFQDDGDPVGVLNPSIAPGAVHLPNGASASHPACGAIPAASADLTNFGGFLGLDDRDAASRFLAQAGLTASGAAVPGATATLRNLTYLELPNDHTTGFTTQGPTNIKGHTPRAQIAENDQAVGTVISALSKSAYWSRTAVFVVEDDSQDGPDHVDGHRNVLLVASPYTRQESGNGCYSGYVGHVHNDQAGVLRTIELMLGLPALSSYDQNAAPLYDLFQAKSTPAQLTAADLKPFDQPAPAPFVEEKVGDPSAGTPAEQAALQADSATLDLTAIDRAGPGLEAVLWRSTHPGQALPWQLNEALAPGHTEDKAGATAAMLHAQAQQATLKQRSTTKNCAPIAPGGATPTTLLGAPPRTVHAESASDVRTVALAATGLDARSLGALAVALLVGAAYARRRSQATG